MFAARLSVKRLLACPLVEGPSALSAKVVGEVRVRFAGVQIHSLSSGASVVWANVDCFRSAMTRRFLFALAVVGLVMSARIDAVVDAVCGTDVDPLRSVRLLVELVRLLGGDETGSVHAGQVV